MAVASLLLRPTLFSPSNIIFSILFLLPFSSSSAAVTDSEALIQLKTSFTNASHFLTAWVPASEPCKSGKQWEGVICYNGIVSGLRLENMGLSGKIDVDALVRLKGLRSVSFMRNKFTGPIPEFHRMGVLKAIYLSGNQFTGSIPEDYFLKLGSLKKIWLSDNNFAGEIPASLALVPNLMELHLENNGFSGKIPNLQQRTLKRLNMSNNKLDGEIPPGLLRFDAKVFEGNAGLCGQMFGKECQSQTLPSPSMEPDGNENNNADGNTNGKSSSKKSTIAIVVTSGVVLVSLVVVLFLVKSTKKKEEFDVLGKDINDNSSNKSSKNKNNSSSNNNTPDAVEVKVAPVPTKKEVESLKKGGSSSSKRSGSAKVGELVMVNDEKGIFGLPDLMKAAAEVLGNGGLGSSYKAVMANGVAVVVKRMKEMSALNKDEFDTEMRRLGTLRNWNILTPLAYHYRKDEKLVIYEYVPKGSLLYLLHGDRGPSHAEFDWAARLKIVKGIARGMLYLHTELGSLDLPHGNLKSSNILLGPDYQPLLSDYGFRPLINSSNLSQALFAYKAPEAVQFGQVSPKCDVYCIGIVILEILTGKFPSQYLANGKGGTDVVQWVISSIAEGRETELLDPEIANSKNSLSEMVQLLHVGAACVDSDPERRLDLVEAVRRIEDIKVQGGSTGSRSMEVLPSLRDGYADSATQNNIPITQDAQNRRRHESKGSASAMGSRSDDNCAFAIS